MQNRVADEPVRVLLTGAGSIGRRHANNLRALLPRAELSMVCRSPASREVARECGARAVDSVEAGLEGKPQMGVVCSTSDRHARDMELLRNSVEALYIEKPVVIERDDLEQLRSVANRGAGLATVVGCNLRYLGAVRKLAQAIAGGEAGRVASAGLQVGQWLPDWRPGRDYRESYSARRAQGGGVIFDLVHEIDSACFLFGAIRAGQAAAGRSGALEIDGDDSAAITLMMESGVPVQVSLDYISREPVREYRVTGDQATLRLDIVRREFTAHRQGRVTLLDTQATDWDMAGTYVAAMEDLLSSWQRGTATRYPLADALHTTGWMIDLERNAWRSGATR